MTDLTAKAEWSAVRQLEVTDRALAGRDGILNAQAQALVNRTEFLAESKADLIALNALAGGKYSYKTYELMLADIANIRSNSSIDVTNDSDETKNATYTYDGIAFVKSEYDPSEIMKKYTDDAVSDVLEKSNESINSSVKNREKLIKESLKDLIKSRSGYVIAEILNDLLHFKDTLSFKDIFTTEKSLVVKDESGYGYDIITQLKLISDHNEILNLINIENSSSTQGKCLTFPNFNSRDGIFIKDDAGYIFNLVDSVLSVLPVNIDVSQPLITSKIANWGNRDLLIYVPSLLRNRVHQLKNEQVFVVVNHNTKRFETYGKLKIKIPNFSEISGQCTFSFRDIHDENNRTQINVNLVSVEEKNNKNIKVLVLGDSIVQMGASALIKVILAEHGYVPKMIGTSIGDRTSYLDVNLSGEFGEGRGGWKASTYTNSTTAGKRPAITSVADYLALPENSSDNNNRRYFNPFLRAANQNDEPNLIRNGYVFDVKDYLEKFNLEYPDVIYIGLGTNDITNTAEEDFFKLYYEDMSLIISQFVTALPDSKIVLGLPTTGSNSIRNKLWETHYFNAFRVLMQLEKEYVNVSLCPTWIISSAESDYILNTLSTDQITNAQFGYMSDALHPRAATKLKLYDIVSAHIAATFESQI